MDPNIILPAEESSEATAYQSQRTFPPDNDTNKLILFFDGTGNAFTGSDSDTNVVKLLRKLDRHQPRQFHYYQTGIGTFDINETSVNKSLLGAIKDGLTQIIDKGFGTTFDTHVIAGYRFLMRYYESGTKIYMFGFSRGAYTARFLARMINTVGLLCKGNEEMVPFAFRLYQRYLAGEFQDEENSLPQKTWYRSLGEWIGICKPQSMKRGIVTRSSETKEIFNEILAFSKTFCRGNSRSNDRNIKVFFLGIWDCVSSVSIYERKAYKPRPVLGTAEHVRHAVSLDEHRVKFKPALLAQDTHHIKREKEDIKEVWFAGCHGDVGGGWPANDTRIKKIEDDYTKSDGATTSGNVFKILMSFFWKWGSLFWSSVPARPEGTTDQTLQLSDIALAWMIQELWTLGESEPSSRLAWRSTVDSFMDDVSRMTQEDLTSFAIHDALVLNSGTDAVKVFFWTVLECLPFSRRQVLRDGKWSDPWGISNKGAPRAVPRDVVLHNSVYELLDSGKYHPKNTNGIGTMACFQGRKCLDKLEVVKETEGQNVPDLTRIQDAEKYREERDKRKKAHKTWHLKESQEKVKEA